MIFIVQWSVRDAVGSDNEEKFGRIEVERERRRCRMRNQRRKHKRLRRRYRGTVRPLTVKSKLLSCVGWRVHFGEWLGGGGILHRRRRHFGGARSRGNARTARQDRQNSRAK